MRIVIGSDHAGYPLKASISPDRLVRDDVSSLVAVVRDSLAVALVDGAPSPNRFASESGLLVAALSPRGDVPSGVSVSLIDGSIGHLNRRHLPTPATCHCSVTCRREPDRCSHRSLDARRHFGGSCATTYSGIRVDRGFVRLQRRRPR